MDTKQYNTITLFDQSSSWIRAVTHSTTRRTVGGLYLGFYVNIEIYPTKQARHSTTNFDIHGPISGGFWIY